MTFAKTRRRDPTAPLAPRAAWSRGADAFLGSHGVSDSFDVDGRDDDHDVMWEAPFDAAPFWASPEGYAIHLVTDPDWSPETLILLSPGGEPCGFYSGGEAWVDEGHRGRGLGSEMVLAMTEALGRSPTANSEPTAFSPAGMWAHRMAWCAAVERAAEAGRKVRPDDVREAAHYRALKPHPTPPATPNP